MVRSVNFSCILLLSFHFQISFLDYGKDDIMNVMVKREEAKNFFQRDRRDLNHECYTECCRFEEVREHYEFDVTRAVRYTLNLCVYN